MPKRTNTPPRGLFSEVRKGFLKRASLASFTLSLLAAQGATISNPSFEEPLLGPGEISFAANWLGEFGTFRAGEYGQDGIAPDGAQIAYLNAGNGTAWQTLPDTFAPDTNYRLDFYFSARSGPALTDVSAVLFAGAITNIAELNGANIIGKDLYDGGAGIVADEFRLFSLFVPASAVAAQGAIGQAIGIGFFGAPVNGLGNSSTAGNSDFDLDHVSLSSTPIAPVPEPTALVLGALGLTATLVWRRKTAATKR